MRYEPVTSAVEIWADIYGYKGYYQISNLGKVRSVRRKNRILSIWRNHGGYNMTTMSKNGNKISKAVAIMVAKRFVPNPYKRPEVNHKDGNKDNNAAYNLEWNTRLQNQQHSVYVLGKHFCGEKHSLSKLTEVDVIKIINLYKTGDYTYAEIARMFNMEDTQINRIVKRKSWKHLKIA